MALPVALLLQALVPESEGIAAFLSLSDVGKSEVKAIGVGVSGLRAPV